MSKNENIIEKMQKMMAVASNGCDAEEVAKETRDNSNGLFEQFINDMGGFSVALGAMRTASVCAEKVFPNSEKFQKCVNFIGGSIPVAMTIHKSIQSIRSYFQRKINSNRPHIDEEDFIMKHILDMEDTQFSIWSSSVGGREKPILEWLQKMPNTDSLASLGIFDSDFEFVDDIKKIKPLSSYYFIYEFISKDSDNVRFIVNYMTDIMGDFRENATLHHSGMYYVDAVRILMNYSYIESLDYKNNLITLGETIETSPRRIIDHEVYQISDDMRNEIRNYIRKKKKRGYAIAGLPGTGKSTMVDKVVDEFRDIPAISIPCECHTDFAIIKRALIMSQLVSPCIVIFEDIDSLPLRDKHSPHLATFIEFLDSAKFSDPVIFMATMNEPENIHESLMDRRGRFDKVILVDPPRMREDIIDVMSNVYRRECGEEMDIGTLDDEFFDIVSKCGMRHSDYAEIINRVINNDMPLEASSFTSVAIDIRDTQDAVNKFKVRRKKGVVEDDGDNIKKYRDILEGAVCETKCDPSDEEVKVEEWMKDPDAGVGVGVEIM